ncbi:MAG: aconitase/3-isopropylmalate dehydratase large subunit family protein [Bacteroidales bacterium]|jgi:homoaconitate hydratase family protein/3-isopropylmalate dehydratase small subunit|nr:aconitase/3-isopropylmalate dehydratase large subunit family protein [Bacteroidales bacterium]NCU36007.1 homoaconitate hydratase family protein [Candidatus Falkowbacteria bacterium]MDD3527330.1 aconitase/3-isopropylmalate dehydratase large subunit family protein [Bacteroidales bacterium]MDD4176974.1 aconitase/3-isopropylmalate dehydratase large subunit family protein [Bacteroidales bacterium]MDD4740353.1 aconitase/3-isopropylmalate dehydratase large subunit family protein [Bacteroidales bact
MQGRTFVEKIFDAPAGSIVFKKPDLILTHDNTASIDATFKKMNGERVADPDQLLIVLDHNAPPTSSKLANQYQQVRDIVKEQGISKFYDIGRGICHQIMSYHARPGMVVVGSDSHTCTAGAFNAFAAGIDRTESAGLWRQGETWFRVPETLKITLTGKLPAGVYAKDLSLWIIGMIGSSGADYMSIEYHGDGVKTLSVSQRMTIANLASEMGAKNAVFPCDEVLKEFLGEEPKGVWADADARYAQEIEINMSKLFPVVAAPHHVDNVKALSEVQGTRIDQALIGTCTNGRMEDLREAAAVLKGKQLPATVQMLVIPASREIYLEALKEGVIEILIEAGAQVLSTSCGPCLGTGQGIPADGYNVISTANRNFKGRMGNKESSIYLASPAAVAWSALKGEITDPRGIRANDVFPYQRQQSATVEVAATDDRYTDSIWNYADVDNLNTDQMFAGNLTYTVLSSEAEKIIPHLFKGFDDSFSERAQQNDIIIAGANFGCGSSREHPAVGLAHIGIKAVICKSVNRIFYRSAVNQGLPIIILPEAVHAYRQGDETNIDFEKGTVTIAGREFHFAPLPDKLMKIFDAKGLVNYIKEMV